jgi:ABC-2 type transport system permease protein
MAQLSDWSLPPWTSAQSRAQLATIAWLRWRIFVNNFRAANKKRGIGRLVFLIVLRILGWTAISAFFIVPIGACAYFGYASVANNHPNNLTYLFWTVFSINFFISINVSSALATIGFDLTTLLRFPLSFPRYLLVRLFFGLFSIPTLVANLALAATAIGIGVADPARLPWAALVVGIFAMHNVFFLRMIFAWVDRWLATRRAREIFGGIILFISLGFQFLFIGGSPHHRGERFAALGRLLKPLHPITQFLPPSLAANAIRANWQHEIGASFAGLFGLIAFALAFLVIFAVRLKKEFRGENLSEAGRRPPAKVVAMAILAQAPAAIPSGALIERPVKRGLLPPTVAACLEKELIYLRRSGAQLYGLITPLFFVFIIARRNSFLGATTMLLPSAVSYVLLGLLANLYNVLGVDGPGFNFYLLAPVRLRDVILAKNLVSGGVIVGEILLTCVAVGLIQGALPSAAILGATLSWAAFALFTNLAVGDLRSVLSPLRFEPGKVRRTPTGKGGALLILAVIFGTFLLGAPVIYACHHFGQLWLATPILLFFAICSLTGYIIVLTRIDSFAAAHRDELIEALCKA